MYLLRVQHIAKGFLQRLCTILPFQQRRKMHCIYILHFWTNMRHEKHLTLLDEYAARKLCQFEAYPFLFYNLLSRHVLNVNPYNILNT